MSLFCGARDISFTAKRRKRSIWQREINRRKDRVTSLLPHNGANHILRGNAPLYINSLLCSTAIRVSTNIVVEPRLFSGRLCTSQINLAFKTLCTFQVPGLWGRHNVTSNPMRCKSVKLKNNLKKPMAGYILN